MASDLASVASGAPFLANFIQAPWESRGWAASQRLKAAGSGKLKRGSLSEGMAP